MNEALNAVRQLVTWIFRISGEVWIWVISQINRLVALNWYALPWWKQIGLVLIAGAAGYCIYQVYKPIWDAITKLLGAFGNLLSVLTTTLPWIVLAGVAVLVGLKLLNLP